MSTVHTVGPVARVELEDGAFWRVRLNTPKANIIDCAMVEALSQVFVQACENTELKAICLEGAGPHFSFGASVDEHLPGQVDRMLPAFHDLFRLLIESSIPLIAAVRGQCLGGGLELAAFCHRVFASPEAKFGQPEIKLGVVAPVGSLILPERMGRSAADDLLLTGRVIDADDALQKGLVDEIADDPFESAHQYVREHLLPLSASSLCHAVAAARESFHRRFLTDLPEQENAYLHDLMSTSDAVEGVRAFLEKRPPHWSNS